MSTASTRPQLQIRHAREDDASSLCEIFNEAVQDRLETFDSEPRSVDDQRLLIAAAEMIRSIRFWSPMFATGSPAGLRSRRMTTASRWTISAKFLFMCGGRSAATAWDAS